VSSRLRSTHSTGRSLRMPATPPGTDARWGTEVVTMCPATPGATSPGSLRIWISAGRSARSPTMGVAITCGTMIGSAPPDSNRPAGGS